MAEELFCHMVCNRKGVMVIMDNYNENININHNKSAAQNNVQSNIKSESFSYTYSAKEQEELKKIRQKYVPKEENKMEQLRRLDQSVTRKGTMTSIIIGVIGALILGVGMCCVMVWEGIWFVPGIVIGLIGMGIMGAAYPVYNYVTKKERQRIAPEIIRLTDELIK